MADIQKKCRLEISHLGQKLPFVVAAQTRSPRRPRDFCICCELSEMTTLKPALSFQLRTRQVHDESVHNLKMQKMSYLLACICKTFYDFCKLKAYSNYSWGRKINLSGIKSGKFKRSRSGPNSVYVNTSRGDNIQGIFGAIGPFWAKRGLGRVPRSQSLFLCGNPENLSATRQRSIFTKFGHETQFGVPSRNPERHFPKFSLQGSLAPKSEIENRSNRHLTQSRLQVMGCTAERCCLLHVVV